MDQSNIAHEPVQPDMAELFRVFGKIGLLSFGGPAGQIALMHRILVDEKRWLDEPRFLHALNYCMLLPGPEAMQLATYAGWLLRGVKGGLIAGLLFVLPGAAVLMALSTVYLLAGEVTIVQGLLFGLKAAVLAVVVEALAKVSKRALKNQWMVALAILAFVSIAFLQLPFPVIVLGAAVIGALGHVLANGDGKAVGAPAPELPLPEWAQPSWGRFMRTSAIWLAVWLVPLFLLHAILGGNHVFSQEANFFSIMAAVTFGGAYAVLAWVAQQAVEVYGWLRPDEMLTGLGLAETTPGPLILVLAFVGFLGGARLSGLDPVLGGLGGGLVALWFTFAPCFLWIFAGAPYVETVRNVRWLSTALAAVTAAVVGVIANLALWFGLHVLFADIEEVAVGPALLMVPDLSSIDLAAALIALAAGIALLRLHVNMIAVLAAAALVGMVWVLAA
ncbi:chromate efflux transporter [Mesorhizobium microcysteis]|uniref:Chromate efflux transporter n=1 Tax=Neoaquamicrobium microcysteis TaxID=2682781 RepID=A0A5D4GT44_9HYPH|nr:chromate efflux transporter [Mesorhizobium microcysteis]TYR30445.1 chromate efflux transporter [Mesorhizobium microcysteis]